MSDIRITPLSDLRSIGKAQFESLYHISRLLNRLVYQDSLIEEALDLVVKVIHAERGLFVRYDAEGNAFSIIAARNVNRERLTDLSTFSSGILQQVIDKKAPCLYHDVQSDPNLSQFESVLIHQIKSVIGVPIFHQGEIWGVILADSREDRREFTDENLTFLDFFSNLVSLALDKIIRFEALEQENRILENRLQATQAVPDMIGESQPMRQMAAMIHRVARTDATVLILGESGTGKDLAAQAIHKLSARKNKPFLAQFCGSIPDTLLESELFGYKKGAFSGATSDKKGLFEVADQGTFFLDEIGDISAALQAKLLRVLQNQEIMRLGDHKITRVNVRIIAATNKDLKALAATGEFREDLFYRLNVFPIVLPPLRERREDLALLAEHFIRRYAAREVGLSAAALQKLRDYHWPGNVRQLENVIQRALILGDGGALQPDQIILDDDGDPTLPDFAGTLKDLEIQLLQARLKKYDGNRTLTARSLGVSVRWVQLKLKEMG
ncbi:MAG: sigma 54-interacting transcriptional regulator [Calditrichaeota bacterium]|nr:sigma 54-interacting transcriptional regulator [Calditrichota bacterium]